MILEILADVEPTTAAAERRQWVAMKRETGKMRSYKVRSRKNVVVVVDGDDHVTTLLVRVQDADVAPLDTPPRQVRIQFRVLQMYQIEKQAAEQALLTLDMYPFWSSTSMNTHLTPCRALASAQKVLASTGVLVSPVTTNRVSACP
jgi:hypothetical protein